MSGINSALLGINNALTVMDGAHMGSYGVHLDILSALTGINSKYR
jgi:hypothetical protein